MSVERKRMETQNRYCDAVWFQRNDLKPSMTAQAMPFKHGYRYVIHDVSTHQPYKAVLTGWAPNMGRVVRKVQGCFQDLITKVQS